MLRWLPLFLAATLAPFVEGEIPVVGTEKAACCCHDDGMKTSSDESCAHGCTETGDCAACQFCRAQAPAALDEATGLPTPHAITLSISLVHEFAEQRVDRPAAPPPKV